MISWWWLVAVAAGSLALAALVRAVAPRIGLVDKPNARSLHARPTPRGGGLGIVLAFLALALAATLAGDVPTRVGLALLVPGGIVALVGLVDDRLGLPNKLRVAVWLVAAALATWLLGGLPTLDVGPLLLSLGVVGAVLAVLGLVWMVNLYNFMDGIDGLAASEAVVAASGAGALLFLAGDAPLALLAFALAAASLGFLALNWQPARIFMGDVGSGFLGFAFGALALASERDGSLPLLAWAILLAPFLIDATLTVVVRIARGAKFYVAHKEHAYQLAVQRGRSHQDVVLAFLAIDLTLVPVAWLALREPRWLVPLAAISLIALAGIWWLCRSRLQGRA